jgi:hypothetical protein
MRILCTWSGSNSFALAKNSTHSFLSTEKWNTCYLFWQWCFDFPVSWSTQSGLWQLHLWSAVNSKLSILDLACSTEMCLATGAVCTISLECLCVEIGEPPLSCRRKRLLCCYMATTHCSRCVEYWGVSTCGYMLWPPSWPSEYVLAAYYS